MVNFCLKGAQVEDLLSKIQGFEAFEASDLIHAKASKGNIIGNRIQF